MSLVLPVGQTVLFSGVCISVKVLSVVLVLYFWHPWRWNLSFQYHLPINASEPLVVFDLFGSTLGASHSQALVSTQETTNQISSLWFNMWWEFVISIHNLLINSNWIVIIERWIACEHFED